MKKKINSIVIRSAVLVDLHSLIPYENNSKIHTVKQLEGIRKSIEDFGFMQDLVIDRNNVIVAGHGRYEAAASLGMEKVPCVIVDDLTEKQIDAYRILDNKLAETGTDARKLQLELNRLGFDFTPYKLDLMPSKIELSGASEKTKKDKTEFIVLINCASQREQQEIYEEMEKRGFQCTLMS